ncbi:UNVERIFIED_CONTAM: Nuclear speckle splicing regulatory protein 1 [Sesamum indicum]
MKKYGLQLRVQPQQKKQPAKPPIPPTLGFDDDDDDNVERDIMRQAYKNKTHKDIEEQHKKALEEDPSVFDYDGVYDKMKEKQVRPIQQDRQDRKPRYIQALMDKAKQREREHEVIYERKLAKERSQDEHLYADKDKFVTSAYKKKLAEQAKWLEEERLRDMREEKEDVTKKTDLSDFYFNLAKNVAFGATEADSRKPGKQPEEVVVQQPIQVSPPASSTDLESSRTVKSHQDETATSVSPKGKSECQYTTTTLDTSTQDQITNEPSVSNQDHQNTSENAVVAAKDHHRRSEDTVAAAKERFLARKKARVL